MKVRRFTGINNREAMRMVRAALGDDALILANRQVDEGIEILAVSEQEVSASAVSDFSAEPLAAGDGTMAPPAPAQQGKTGDSLHQLSEQLLREMHDMRVLLAREQTRLSPVGDCRTRLQQLLQATGFSQQLQDEVLAALPGELQDAPPADTRPLAWLQRQLKARLAVLDDENDFLDEGGVVALIGPTGVGKTTTTAKLAARYVMRHGTDKVALVTTDSFRIGAHEQLRIYSRLLDVPIYALDAEQPLTELLIQLQHKHLVIIDTVGMSQRDQRMIEQVARLGSTTTAVRLVLLLNAASQPEILDEVMTNYRQAAHAAGAQLNDCLVTKLDEAGRLGPLLDGVTRHGLRMLFVSEGQRVPEDLGLPDPEDLIRRAVASPAGAMPVALAVPPANWAQGLLGQGRQVAAVLGALRDRMGGFVTLEAVWDLCALPPALQEQRLNDILNVSEQEPPPATGMLWARRGALQGCDWSMPDMGLDARGGWLALPSLQRRQPVSQAARLARASADRGVTAHLLPGLPDAETWTWLDSSAAAWSCQARPGQRVLYQSERQALSQLSGLAVERGEYPCAWQRQPARLLLSQLRVAVNPGGRPAGVNSDYPLVRAWFGEIRSAEGGTVLARRYWLTPENLGDEVLPLLLGQLYGEALPPLTRRTWQRLQSVLPERCSSGVRVLIASGFAAVACHLEQSTEEWAMDLRAGLVGLLGGRRRCSAQLLVEALIYLCVARDAIRHVASPGLEAVR